MLPTPILAEVDGFQIAIIVLAVVFGFIKWLWEQWSGKKSEELPERLEEAEIERQLREAAWRQQTGQNTPPLPAPPPPPANPTPSPWQEIRKVWQEAQNASEQQPRPPPAPQRPQPQKPRYTAQTPSQAAKVPAAAPATPQPEMVVKAQTVFSAPAVVSQPAVGAMLESLRALRTDPAAMRRAIVLSEVLGPPKALS
jgi:hypothetical protein